MSVPSYKPRHLPGLEGLRAIAAFGVVLTHVAFQTGVDPRSLAGSVLARFDFFVPVFFALSAFLLWRNHHGDREAGTIGRYLVNRTGRILPAYLVCVVAVILLLPEASRMSGEQILANLTLTQVYVVDGLAPGLTHLWSLSVEVGFYLVLPLLALSIGRLPRRGRVLTILALAVLSLGWAWLPFVTAGPDAAAGIPNRQIWPVAYAPWFAVGMIAAEFSGRVPDRVRRVLGWRWAWWWLALMTAWLAGQEWFGPVGLTHPEPAEFTRRVLAGTVFAFAVVVPEALDPGARWLASPVMKALGRWSYSIFLWHVAMLSLAFPLLGLNYFSGGFWPVLAVTLVLTLPVSAASYVFLEEPGKRLVRAATSRRARAVESPA
ncbi:acyltransferase [Corynebacterium sp. YIM 101645]|uniref:Acyltransferase n=1 Tax=Corynebacterium lemuris TaxID=1859292 RepID=A0ABT2G2P6_9CORY|nr:acyltransferase [Corynebacterium lemuris]MCS5480547.1 acyltransferase [Corynebacterium lemuris]